MKVAAIRLPASLDSLVIEDRPEPVVSAGTVKVRWRALSLNFHDFAVVSGLLPATDRRIPVSDAAGEVVAVGSGVNRWKPGDKVISVFFPDWRSGDPNAPGTRRLSGDTADGYAAEFSVVDQAALTKMPAGYSFAEAATLPCAALTAWRALVDAGGVQRGQQVLIQGTGGVSVFALQFAKALGAIVYATSSSPEKCERLQLLGADHCLNYRANPNWGESVARQSGGGVDLVIDVGGPATLSQSLDAARVAGRIVLVGILGGLEAALPMAKLLLKQLHLRAITVGNHAQQERMIELIEASGIRPVIDSTYPLARLADAIRYQLSGQHFGKIVIALEAQ